MTEWKPIPEKVQINLTDVEVDTQPGNGELHHVADEVHSHSMSGSLQESSEQDRCQDEPKSFQASEEVPDLGERYEILDYIGAGGMGSVWKVYDRQLEQVFAVKVLKPELVTDEVASKRFRREAQLASDLTHANIAAIFGPGEDI